MRRSSLSPDAVSYFQRHSIRELLNRMLQDLLSEKPPNSDIWMWNWFSKEVKSNSFKRRLEDSSVALPIAAPIVPPHTDNLSPSHSLLSSSIPLLGVSKFSEQEECPLEHLSMTISSPLGSCDSFTCDFPQTGFYEGESLQLSSSAWQTRSLSAGSARSLIARDQTQRGEGTFAEDNVITVDKVRKVSVDNSVASLKNQSQHTILPSSICMPSIRNEKTFFRIHTESLVVSPPEEHVTGRSYAGRGGIIVRGGRGRGETLVGLKSISPSPLPWHQCYSYSGLEGNFFSRHASNSSSRRLFPSISQFQGNSLRWHPGAGSSTPTFCYGLPPSQR